MFPEAFDYNSNVGKHRNKTGIYSDIQNTY